MAQFRKGDRVRYTGTYAAPPGTLGTVQAVSAKGWILVTYDGIGGPYPTAQCFLELVY